MLFLYLDESGDLGFDFVNKKPSKYFVVTILAVRGHEANRLLINGVKKTLKRKLNPKGKQKRIVSELKGTKTLFEIKNYFFRQVKGIDFDIYALVLNKRRVYENLIREKSRVYNFVARTVLDRIPLGNAALRVELTIDKSDPKLLSSTATFAGSLSRKSIPPFPSISITLTRKNTVAFKRLTCFHTRYLRSTKGEGHSGMILLRKK
jgi:hypothetical protein